MADGTFDNLTVIGTSDLGGGVRVGGDLTVGDPGVGLIRTLSVTGAISGGSTLSVTEAISGGSTLSIAGAISGGSTLSISGAISSGGDLSISGAISGGALSITGLANLGGTAHVSGNLTVGDPSVSPGSTLTVTGAISGNTLSIAGAISGGNTLSISGAISGGGDLSVAGRSALGGNVRVSGDLRVDGAGQIAGNVGIGPAAPLSALHVARPGHLNVIFDRTDTSDHLTAVVGSAGSGLRFSDANFFFIGSQPYSDRNNGTTGNEHVRITSAGLVGIGLTAPRTPLHVLGRISTGQDFRSAGAITFFPPDGFAWFHIDNGPAGGRPIGRLRISHGGNPGDTEIISILQNANVGIGITNPGVKLHVVGNRIRLTKANNPNHFLDLRADGGALDLESEGADLFINNNNRPVRIRNLVNISSRELKENILDLSNEEASETLEGLHPVKFNYKSDSESRPQLGFIADDVPDIVATPDRKGLRIMDIVAILTKAMQEQKKTISLLTQKVETLDELSK